MKECNYEATRKEILSEDSKSLSRSQALSLILAAEYRKLLGIE